MYMYVHNMYMYMYMYRIYMYLYLHNMYMYRICMCIICTCIYMYIYTVCVKKTLHTVAFSPCLCGTAANKTALKQCSKRSSCDKTLLSQSFYSTCWLLYMWPIYTSANCAFHDFDNCNTAAIKLRSKCQSVASVVLECLCTGKRLVKGRSGLSFFHTMKTQRYVKFFWRILYMHICTYTLYIYTSLCWLKYTCTYMYNLCHVW